MTEEEKAKLRAERDAAHLARYNERLALEREAIAYYDAQHQKHIAIIRQGIVRINHERDEAIAQVHDEIAKLLYKIECLKQIYLDRIVNLDRRIVSAYGRRKRSIRALDIRLQKLFPDLVGAALYDPEQWKPLNLPKKYSMNLAKMREYAWSPPKRKARMENMEKIKLRRRRIKQEEIAAYMERLVAIMAQNNSTPPANSQPEPEAQEEEYIESEEDIYPDTEEE